MSDETPYRYTAALAGQLEVAWQDRWEEAGAFHAPNPAGPWADPERVAALGEKLLVLDMFPYPSGAGLHVGHPLGYIATDVYCRYHRMRGRNVLHALGYDAFGLPAEQYAVQTGQHPRKTTEDNIAIMQRQLRRLGLGFDERRSFATIDEDYYRWTQWIFTRIRESWYDPDAVRPDGSRGAARPIGELVERIESGRMAPPTSDGTGWAELTPRQRADLLDGFRLAYPSEAPVNWCPGLGTVLSNEEVTSDGRSERGNFPVFRRNLGQWMMRITAYADRLADDLDRVDWPEKVKLMQRNWIGRSTGALVAFPVTCADGSKDAIEVFTTRPDTLFGATFMAVAPEHPLVDRIVREGDWPPDTPLEWRGADAEAAGTPVEAVTAYRLTASRRSEVERQTEGRDKTGVFTGTFATNPVNGESIPVFVAEYVLMGYGTGAIMAVPGHDERDFEYASRFGLPIVRVVAPTMEEAGAPLAEAYSGAGVVVNSRSAFLDLDGLAVEDAKEAIIAALELAGAGSRRVNYRLHDWLFSRQRYWGEPFPVVWDEDGVAHSLPDSMLPLTLPDVPDYEPKTYHPDDAASDPEAPLSRVPEWVHVDLDLGDGRGVRRYRRETNTMPNWAGSCWYYLRYLDPANADAFVDPANERYWMARHDAPVAGAPQGSIDPGGVDLYVGGVEHAVLHLLYARFWHKVLYDLGYLSSEEPFRTYFSQGYIQAPAYKDARGQYVPADEVVQVAQPETGAGGVGEPVFLWEGQPVSREFGKIGKSLKNMITPDDMYEEFGADTFRVYEMALGPLEQSKPWETRTVVGAQRFLQRLWRNVVDESTGQVRVVDEEPDQDLLVAMHKTVAGVREDYDRLHFNTAVAKLIELNNLLTKAERSPRAVLEALVLMVAPVAPHIAEELWLRLGHEEGIGAARFPEADPALVVDETVTCVIQIRGKVRDRVQVRSDIGEDELRTLALSRDKVVAATGGGVHLVIVRPPALVNVVPA